MLKNEKSPRLFASDNCSTVHPRVMAALQKVNEAGHVISYGDDIYTEAALTQIQELFGAESGGFFVYNGTGANVIAIRSLLKGYESVLTADISHLNEDECGSLEALGGMKIEPLPHRHGKIRAADIPGGLGRRGFVHSVQPRLLSITQSNELGQVYSIEEMQEIGRVCREYDLLFHVDGARISNAVASLLMDEEPQWAGLSSAALIRRGREILSAMTLEAGVQLLSLGGTKNGLMFGECIVLMGQKTLQAQETLLFYRKQMTQLASKMRYISVQFEELYGSDLWLRNALHANSMARRLADGLTRLYGQASENVFMYPVQANALFIILPPTLAEKLRPRYGFYDWNEGCRLMCSWDSTAEDVDGFIAELGRDD